MSKTIPEQLAEALAENAALKSAGSDAEAAAKLAELAKRLSEASQELASAKTKISELEQQLATAKPDAESAFKRGHDDAMAGLNAEIEKRATFKACEIAKSVGQPVPSEWEEVPTPLAGKVDPVESIASGYRHKYGIS